MKKDTHPKYYPNAQVECTCGNSFTIGSTRPTLNIEICYKCHPFYTGEEKLINTAGMVEKFKERQRKAKTNLKKSKNKINKT